MKKKTKRLCIFISILILPPLIVGICAMVLMKWPLRTRISARLTVNRIDFTVGAADQSHSTAILKSVSLQSLAVERFSKLSLSPEVLWIADPKQYSIESDAYPESAWFPLALDHSLVSFIAVDQKLTPRVTVEGSASGAGMRLDEIRLANRSGIKLEAREESKLNIFLRTNNGTTSIIPGEEFKVIADYCNLVGVAHLPFQQPSQAYRAKVPANNPSIDIDAYTGELILIAKFPRGADSNPFSTDPIPVAAIDFTRVDESDGQKVTALIEGTEISYPDYPDKPKVKIEASEFIVLKELDRFSISELAYKPTSQTMTLAVNGIAADATGGPRNFLRDLRATAFDYFWYSNKLIKLIAVVGWVASLMVTGYQLYQEYKKNTSTEPTASMQV